MDAETTHTPRAKAPCLVIGGGIAGLATSICLARQGKEVTVIEARMDYDAVEGLFLNVASNGLRMLQTIGVMSAIRPQGSRCTTHVLHNGRGRRLGRVTNTSRLGEPSSILVRREVVLRSLRDAAVGAGVDLRCGQSLGEIAEQADGGFEVVTTAGETIQAALLFGCDGIHSKVRRHIDPAAPGPSYTGLLCIGGLAETPDLPDTPDELQLVFGHEAFFGYLTDRGRTYWFSNVAQDREPAPRELDHIDPLQWTHRLSRMHARDFDPIGDIITAPQATFVAYPLYDVRRVPRWHRGNAVILGDAAHATTPHAGQGASMALEDAVALSACLKESPDAPTAFAAFQKRREARVDRIVAFSRRMGDNKTVRHPLKLAVRDTVMPVALKTFATPRRREWIYDPADFTHHRSDA